MPIVLDYAPDGAIVGGHFFTYIPEGAVESGSWQIVIQGAVYARLVHLVDPVDPLPGFLNDIGGGRLGVVDAMGQQQTLAGGDATDARPTMMDGVQSAVPEDHNLPQSLPPSRECSRSPSPPAARSLKRRRLDNNRSLEVVLPIAVDIEETSGVASVANTANPNKSGTLLRKQIPHFGPVFPTRRALLIRGDKPFICRLCGEGFAHPIDVKAHFNGHPNIPGRGCWTKHGGLPGGSWDHHPSCKVSKADVSFARCREGWVIADQASWDKINAAADEGRKFKESAAQTADGESEPVKAKRKAKTKGEVGVVEKKAMNAGDNAEVEVGGIGATSVAATGKPEEGTSVVRKEPPKRKVVRAGDETETDLGSSRR